jgi:hypothetical protein
MSSNRMILAKNAAQLAAEEAATYGSSYGLLSAVSAYAPEFLKAATGYGQAYFGPVMPAIDAGISVIARATGSAVRGTFSAAGMAVNAATGVAAAYAVQAVSNAAGLDLSEINPALRVAVEATATSATARLLRFAGEKAATKFGMFNKTVNAPDGFTALLSESGLNQTHADLEAQNGVTVIAAPVHTSPRPGQSN